MRRSYTVGEVKLIDKYLKQKFEDHLDVFAAEAGRDYTKGPSGQYTDPHIQNIWVGFFLSYLIVRHGRDGDSMDIRPGLVPEAEQFFRDRNNWIECQP